MKEIIEPSILWVSYTGIEKSETFIGQTLIALEGIGRVVGITGKKTVHYNSKQIHFYKGFADPKEFSWEKVMRKLLKINFYYRRIDLVFGLRFKRLFRSNPDAVIFLEFANSAVMLQKSIEASKLSFIISVHGMDVTSMIKIEEYKNRLLKLATSHRLVGFVCASHHIKRLLVLQGVPSEKCFVIRLSLDGLRIMPDATISKTRNPSFVHLGRLTEKKHPLATLEAFKLVLESMPSCTLTFIGDGPMRMDLEHRVRRYGIADKVFIAGEMSHKDAMLYVQKHWVFVQHSVTSSVGDQEGFALSPAEAALLELPVISTIHNGIPEHVRHGETGFLVPEFHYELMAERMLELAQDFELCSRFGKAGRKNILEMCDSTRRNGELEILIKSHVCSDCISIVET